MRHTHIFPLFSVLLTSLIPVALQATTIVQLTHPNDASPAGSALSLENVPVGWKYLPAVDLYIVEEEGQERLKQFEADGAVAAREESFDIHLEALPSDPMIKDQGWVENANFDVGATQAWDLVEGLGDAARVTVAIIDTGIDTAHPDLSPNLWTNTKEIPNNGKDDDGNGYIDDVHGYNFWDSSGDVTDDNDHGSHLAGIIGAVGDNGLGVAGVDWNVNLMAVRFTDAQGNGTSSKAIEAIDYAIRNGAKIINASWILNLGDQQTGPNWEDSNLLNLAIQRASDAGILFITAAGNQFDTNKGLNLDTNPVYPASFHRDNMIAVAAVDEAGQLAAYSDYGSSTVDMAAPGAAIVSTAANGGYLAMTGTSMSTAFVSGAAAMVYSIRPDLTAAQVKAILEDSTVPQSSLAGKVATGGMLNLFDAASMAKDGTIPTPPPAPAVSATPSTVSSPTATASDFSVPSGGCSLMR